MTKTNQTQNRCEPGQRTKHARHLHCVGADFRGLWRVIRIAITAVFLTGCAGNGNQLQPINPMSPEPTPLAAASTPITSPTPFKTPTAPIRIPYTHAQGLFSLTYPSYWLANERGDGVDLVEPSGEASVSVFVREASPALTGEQFPGFVDKFLHDIFSGKQNLQILANESQGQSGQDARFSFLDPKYGNEKAQAAFRINGELLFITLGISAENAKPEKVSEMQEIIGSVTPLVKTAKLVISTPSPSWKVYGDKNETYMLLYPDNWTIVETEDKAVFTPSSGAFVMEVYPADGQNEDEYLKYQLAQLRTKYPNLKDFEAEPITLADGTARIKQYAYSDSQGKAISESLVAAKIPSAKRLLVFKFSSALAASQEGLDYFEMMLTGFRWIGKAGPPAN